MRRNGVDMAKSTNQKMKLLYLMQIMLEQTDDEHGLRLEEIIGLLNQYGIEAERKSLYSDFEALRVFGIDIHKEQDGRAVYYHVGNRNLEVAEIRLLVDAIQSSKFITEKKSRQLIKKLEHYVSKYDAKKLDQQVYVHGRIKTMNESIYYNVDKIHSAISNNVKISLQYFQWNVNKEMELRHGGMFYQISPWGLVWDHENYYMIGYDSVAELIKHFRVDKMIQIDLSEAKREGRQYFRNGDIVAYSEKHFGMFAGKEQTVTFLCENQFAGVIIDRFGRDVKMRPVDEGHFQATVEVAVSKNFFGWLLGLGDGVTLTDPEDVVASLREEVQRMYEQYR